MLKELIGYKSFGSPRSRFAVYSTLCQRPCTIDDLHVMSLEFFGSEVTDRSAIVALFTELGFCDADAEGQFSITKTGRGYKCEAELSAAIGGSLVSQMCDEGIIDCKAIQFDEDSGRYYLAKFGNISLGYATLRNLAISAGVLADEGSRIYLDETALRYVMPLAMKLNGMSPGELAKKQAKNQEVGAQAEEVALAYEQRRLGEVKGKEILQVSKVSVSSGFDIASFDSEESASFDRFIEVKAIGKSGFFMSSNELDTAARLGDRYWLYLVDLSRCNEDGYEPQGIQNPHHHLSAQGGWRVVPTNFHIYPVDVFDGE